MVRALRRSWRRVQLGLGIMSTLVGLVVHVVSAIRLLDN